MAVMPDNLMKTTGNTEAPTHLLVVQKNLQKTALTSEEILLQDVVPQENEYGQYTVNKFLSQHTHLICGNEVKAGSNQYGKATQAIWQHGDLDEIAAQLREILTAGFRQRLSRKRFESIAVAVTAPPKRHVFTYLEVPAPEVPSGNMQLGLFDTAPAEAMNRASAYLNAKVDTGVLVASARIVSTIRTDEKPDHDSIVLVTAQTVKGKHSVFRLHSNVAELTFPPGWRNSTSITGDLAALSKKLQEFDCSFLYEGDLVMKESFGLDLGPQGQFRDMQPYYRKGTLVIHNGVPGSIGEPAPDYRSAPFLPFSRSGNKTQFYSGYILLRDSYMRLEQSHDADDVEALREKLRQQYQSFTDTYGQLNLPDNRRLILNDAAFGNIILSSLERREQKGYVAADIQTSALGSNDIEFVTHDHMEALARSLNDYGRVNIDFIALATSSTQADTIAALRTHIFLNPDGDSWETRDLYLSGNVVEKLRHAEIAAANNQDNPYLQDSLEAIRLVQPQPIPFEMLDFNFGERWIPANYYSQYLTRLFEVPTEVHFFKSVDIFKVVSKYDNPKISNEYAVSPKQGHTMLGTALAEHALENTAPFFTYEVGVGSSKVRVPDNEAIQLAHHRIESIRTGFLDFLQELPENEKLQIEKRYNNTFNCYVLRKYDGSHMTFPGLRKDALGIKDLYPSQKDAAFRLLQNRGGIVDHEVGLGKTLTMIIAAHEMKRLGIINKPVILALKANVSQIAHTYRLAYPSDRILAPSEDDFNPRQRQRLFHEIKNNNWDCIILTHEQFGKIPMSPEIRQIIIRDELENVERDLETLVDLGKSVSKRMFKGLEIRKKNLSGALQDLEYVIEKKKDTDISFAELGIDHLFVDESHQFKNLTFSTRHNRVAGLGNMEGSQKALNMLFAIRSLQMRFNSDLNATFLSGTPISNSLTEMYLLFKYLRPRELERQGIGNFDSWAAVFARKTTDFEFSVTNEIISKERFRHFIKVPELAMFYNEIADYKTAAHINLSKPVLEDVLVNIPPTDDQAQFMVRLIEFAKTGNGKLLGRGPLSPREDKARMLIATNYAKKMSLDMRLISARYQDDARNKISLCCAKVAQIYQESTPYRGTQLIFCDMGTPGGDGFNVYADIKRKLVDIHGIPEKEISFIHDWAQSKKHELFTRFNRGDIRVLLGSTPKLGTGTNVQERVVAMHELDIPWKPSEMEQRGGRGARQGNLVALQFLEGKVFRYIYATERSLDNYRFNLLKNKQTFISQMKNCSLQVRTIDEGAIDEQTGMNFSEYIAILSGDTSLLEKSKLEKKIAVLEALKVAHQRDQFKNRQVAANLRSQRTTIAGQVSALQADFQHYHNELYFEKDDTKANPILLKDCRSSDPEHMGNYIIDLYKNFTGTKTSHIGQLYGFDLFIQGIRSRHSDKYAEYTTQENKLFAQRQGTEIRYMSSNGKPIDGNAKMAARYFLHAIDNVDHLLQMRQKDLLDIERELPVLEKILDNTFTKEAELASMKEELRRLEREIAISIQKNQMQQTGELDLAAIAAAESQDEAPDTMTLDLQGAQTMAPATKTVEQLNAAARMLQGNRVIQPSNEPRLRP